jgi:hypothetical protein
MPTPEVTVASLVLVSCVAVAACGTSGAPREASPANAAAGHAGGKAPAVVVTRGNPCSVLLPSEVAEVLGVAIAMREIVDDTTCHFVYDQPSPEGPEHFAVTVHFTGGKAAWLATRAASRLFSGDAGFERLTGVGDEAWLAPMASLLVALRGNASVEFDLRLVPDAREKGIRLARLVASRL